MPEYTYGPRDPMTRNEVGEMVEKADRGRDKTLIALLYLSGARISEVLELKREDIEIKTDELVISVEPQKRDKGSPLRKENNLILPIQDYFAGLVVSYLKNLDSDEPIFKSRQGSGPITRQRAHQIIKDLNGQTSAHFFRHTRANRLAKAGRSLNEVRKWLGRKTQPVEYLENPESEMREIGRDID